MKGLSTSTEEAQAADSIVNPLLPVQRVASVDVYRGLVMFLMMAEVLALSRVSKALPDNAFWEFMAFNQTHVEWIWLSLHDLIQPSFTFLVGVVLPFSILNRKNRGASHASILKHTIKRSLILVFLGIFLRSINSEQTYFTFEDTLTQIGLGYTFLVVLSFYSQRIQIVGLFVILISYWLAFVLYPLPNGSFEYAQDGMNATWEHNLTGFAAHWNKNTNLAWAFDQWFLNLFPREEVFLFNGGGYATLSFIPTLGTMVLGLLAGNALNSSVTVKQKLNYFIIMGVGLLSLGILLHITQINPVVKRIWTPAWTVFSGGICYLFLAFFYRVIDVTNNRKGLFFFTVIGVNSIAAYVIADGGIKDFLKDSLYIHFGRNFDQVFGAPFATLVSGALVLLFEWLILYWMYRKKIFIKI